MLMKDYSFILVVFGIYKSIVLKVDGTRGTEGEKQTRGSNINHFDIGVITPNKIPLTIMVSYLQKKLQKQNFKPLGHYTCMQCGTSHLQTIQENILSHIILATYRKFTVATVRFTQNVICNIYIHPIYQQVANVTV